MAIEVAHDLAEIRAAFDVDSLEIPVSVTHMSYGGIKMIRICWHM